MIQQIDLLLACFRQAVVVLYCVSWIYISFFCSYAIVGWVIHSLQMITFEIVCVAKCQCIITQAMSYALFILSTVTI